MSKHPAKIVLDQFQSGDTLPWPSPTEDLVEIPSERRHDSRTDTSVVGLALSLVVAIVGAIAVGAGYGAIIALCGDKLVNIALACSFPF